MRLLVFALALLVSAASAQEAPLDTAAFVPDDAHLAQIVEAAKVAGEIKACDLPWEDYYLDYMQAERRRMEREGIERETPVYDQRIGFIGMYFGAIQEQTRLRYAGKPCGESQMLRLAERAATQLRQAISRGRVEDAQAVLALRDEGVPYVVAEAFLGSEDQAAAWLGRAPRETEEESRLLVFDLQDGSTLTLAPCTGASREAVLVPDEEAFCSADWTVAREDAATVAESMRAGLADSALSSHEEGGTTYFEFASTVVSVEDHEEAVSLRFGRPPAE